MKSLILSFFLSLGCLYAGAQNSQKKVCVGFRVNKSDLDTTFGDNASQLQDVISFLKTVDSDSTLQLVEVTFCGSASPEGTIALNKRLAARRRASLEQYIRNRVTIPDSIVTRCEGFIAWDRLALLVEQSDMPHKAEAVDVLRNIPEFTFNKKGVMIDSRKKHLMELQYGRTWNYMYKHFFPEIRNASVVLVTVRQKTVEPEPKPKPPVVVVQQDTVALDTVPLYTQVLAEDHRHRLLFALKTNLLYDALAIPNIGVEVPFAQSWSAGGSWMYGWWNYDHHHRYWRYYGGEINVRKWWGGGDRPLTGHHAGIYGQFFIYDFEWGGKGYMGGNPGKSLWDELNYAAGVEYGYSMPIARRLNLDLVFGIGYWGGKYYKYIPLDGHYVWQATKYRHWFGPTKAEVSLVWMLGNVNKKGGDK